MERDLHINELDHKRLMRLIEDALNGVTEQSNSLRSLQVELARATVVNAEELPRDVVTINGYSYENTDALTLNLATASGVNPRIDRVVVRFSAVERRIYLAVLTGTPAEIPTAPALTRSNDIFELGIADVLVPKGSVTVSALNITDTRLNTALCGLVNSLVTAVYE